MKEVIIMKKLLVWMLAAAMFCAVTSGGCGGGSDGDVSGSDEGYVESFGEEGRGNTGEEYDDEGRGTSGTVTDHVTTAFPWAKSP